MKAWPQVGSLLKLQVCNKKIVAYTLAYPISSKEYHDTAHQRVTVTLLFYSLMLHSSCMERVKFPGQKLAEAKSLAKPEQVLQGMEMPKNESGELQLAPTSAAWTSSLPHLQQGTARSLPPTSPPAESQSAASSLQAPRASSQSCSQLAGKGRKPTRAV